MNEKLARLIDRLIADLREDIDIGKLALLTAALEVVCNDLQPRDRDQLRGAVAILVLEQLGASARAIELAKERLPGAPEQPRIASVHKH